MKDIITTQDVKDGTRDRVFDKDRGWSDILTKHDGTVEFTLPEGIKHIFANLGEFEEYALKCYNLPNEVLDGQSGL